MPGVRWSRHLLAAATMVGGSLLVGVFVIGMNAHTRAPEKKVAEKTTEFLVEKTQKQKKKPPPRQQRKPRTNRRAPPAALPDLGASMALAGLPMPDIDATGLLDTGDGRPDPGSMVMTEDAVDSLPKPIRRTSPVFPERARRMGLEGTVTVRLLIDADGNVKRVRLVEAQPEGVFEEAAMAALDQWTFEPATYEGQPVNVWARQTLDFKLD